MSVWSAPSARSDSAVRGAAWCVVRACRICTGTGLTPALIYARPHWAAPDRKRRRPVPRLGQWCVVFRFLDSVHADSHRGGRVAVALAVVRGCCSPHAWRRSHVCLFVCLRVALLLAAELPLPPRSLFQWHELYNPPPPTHTPFPIPSSAIVAYRCCRSLHCARGKLACRLRRARKTHSPCRCGRGAPSRGADVAGAALGRPWRFALCHEKQTRRREPVTATLPRQCPISLSGNSRYNCMRYVDFARVAKTLPKFSKQATHRTRPRRSRPVGSGLVVAPPSPAHICTGTGRTCYLSRASLRVATWSWLRPPMQRSMEQGK